MASELLSFPEQHLAEVVKVVRAGLANMTVDPNLVQHLIVWCEECEAYLHEETGQPSDDEVSRN